MARRDAFAGLTEFLAVARHASFRAASAELRVTPAAVSQAVKSLEARIGCRVPAHPHEASRLPRPGPNCCNGCALLRAKFGEAVAELSAMRLKAAGSCVSQFHVLLSTSWSCRCCRHSGSPTRTSRSRSTSMMHRSTSCARASMPHTDRPLIERDMVAVRLTPDFNGAFWGAPLTSPGTASRARPPTCLLTNASAIDFRPPRPSIVGNSST